jgi:hypothetical protein
MTTPHNPPSNETAHVAMDVPHEGTRLRQLVNGRRLKRLAGVFSAQMLVQLFGFMAGLLLVREMAPVDYGHYTALMTLVGVGAVMLDLGLSAAMLSLGGPHHAQPAPLAHLLADACRLQWRLTAWLALPLAGGGVVLLREQGLLPGHAVALVLLCLAVSVLNARNAVAVAVLRLRGDVALHQRLELGVNLARLAVVAGATLGHIDLALAAVTMAVPSVLMTIALGRALHAPPDAVDVADALGAAAGGFDGRLRSAVRLQAPNSMYYCLSGQLPVLLVAWFGHTQQVAEVGALGRLALLFTVVGSVLAALVMPYFARPRRAAELRGAFLILNALFLGLTLLLALVALTVPTALLSVLGPKYLHLAPEALWMVLSASLAAWSGALYSIGAARGWVPRGWLVIPVGVATLALAVVLVDVSTVAGAFQISTAAGASATLLMAGFVGLRLRRHIATQGPGAVA